jgi:hypothetical protein
MVTRSGRSKVTRVIGEFAGRDGSSWSSSTIVCWYGPAGGFANVQRRMFEVELSFRRATRLWSFVTVASVTFPSASIVTQRTTFPTMLAVRTICGYTGDSMCAGQRGLASCAGQASAEKSDKHPSTVRSLIDFIGPPLIGPNSSASHTTEHRPIGRRCGWLGGAASLLTFAFDML